MNKNFEQMGIDSNTEMMSQFFDHCYEEGLFWGFDSEEQTQVERLIELFNIQYGEQIVEPGCGCGRLTSLLSAKTGDGGMIIACEISPKMFQHCQKLNMSSSVRFYNSTVINLNLPENSMDHVICFNVWPHLEPPDSHLGYFHKILKCGGALHIAHSCGREFINKIHGDASDSMIHKHLLPPAKELAEYLSLNAWKIGRFLDEEKLYYIRAIKP